MRIKLNNSLFSLCLVLLLVCNSCKSNHQNSNNTVSISKATKSTKKNLNKQVEMFKNILDINLETAEILTENQLKVKSLLLMMHCLNSELSCTIISKKKIMKIIPS